MNVAPPSIPIHVARAYGIEQALNQSRAQPVSPIDAMTPGQASTGDNARRLVASLVPGGVDFSGEEPTQRSTALTMYAHPGDRNAAATSVHAGRVLDVSG